MTHDRARKQAIRRRMARTGEKYTDARRALEQALTDALNHARTAGEPPPDEMSGGLTLTDGLTELNNRRGFDDALASEIERAKRFGGDLSLVLIDLDAFKRVNDTYGHQQGDIVLREVARVLRDSLREIDYPARYGGDDFAVIMPGTDFEGAFYRAERIREQIEQLRIPRVDGQGTLGVRTSCGLASAPPAAVDARMLMHFADYMLYEGKRRRRDGGPDGDVGQPRRPEPDDGAGGAALRRPDARDDQKPADAR